jgi:hypothetical protein
VAIPALKMSESTYVPGYVPGRGRIEGVLGITLNSDLFGYPFSLERV